MSWIERALEERLARAAADGELDAPQLRGKPIADLDRQRPQGWWAEQFVQRELSHDRRERAETAVAAARAGFWRSVDVEELHERVRAANADLVRANVNLVESDRLALFDLDEIERIWLGLAR